MEIIYSPDSSQWKRLLMRPVFENTALEATVQTVLNDVKTNGDSAVLHYSQKFDNPSISTFEVSKNEIDAAENQISSELKNAIEIAKNNITAFHNKQAENASPLETMPGVKCWRKSVGIQRVGLYIPGGTAPLFSTILMLAIPAKIAGCKEIILCTPQKEGQEIHPAILYSAKLVGVDKIYKIGGSQAIAAMAYGTETIPKVSKIFGPGNQFVTMAKMLIAKEGIAIDMPAGPSEVMVVADETAIPAFVASDLLSQCEHGADSQAILLSTHKQLLEEVKAEIEKQLAQLPRKELAAKSLEFSKLIYVDNQSDLIDLINEYAPEHLILSVKNYNELGEKVINAGSVFLGNYSPESAGDYASGTNHTLPTNGYAKAYSGVSLDSFVRKITFQEITKEGLHNIGHAIETMAEAEMLDAHKNAVSIRLKQF
jgi:histidinol dehydrogenase